MSSAPTNASPPVLVVLGGTGGIGSALVRRLSAHGSQVAFTGRDPGRVDALARETGASGASLDATERRAVEALLDEVIGRHGRIDGIANCVGSLLLKPAHSTSEQEWTDVVATNLGTAFTTVAAGARRLHDGGSIVLVSSAAARLGFANHEAIAAAKAGVIGLTLSAAATYGPRGIRVNAVAPGLVATPLTERLTGGPAGEASRAMHVLGRLGTSDDVASAIAWLLAPEQSWVTGQLLGVDGGLGAVRSRS